MRTSSPTPSINGRALDALQSLFAQISAVRLNEVRARSTADASGATEFIAHIDIYGRSHTLVCAAATGSDHAALRRSFEQLRCTADAMAPRATPVVIALSASSLARSLCSEYGAGYLDLEGNVRLELGEFFIVRHTLPAMQSTSSRPVRAFSAHSVTTRTVVAA